MPHEPDGKDPNDWHKYFAMVANNRAWELVGKSRTEADELELLNTAHAAAHHWNAIGSELNRMRAKMLLAEVHALLGMGASAYRLSTEVTAYFAGESPPDWEAAFVQVIHAHAAFANDQRDEFVNAYAEASKLVDAIADDEDRAVVLQTFDQVPSP